MSTGLRLTQSVRLIYIYFFGHLTGTSRKKSDTKTARGGSSGARQGSVPLKKSFPPPPPRSSHDDPRLQFANCIKEPGEQAAAACGRTPGVHLPSSSPLKVRRSCVVAFSHLSAVRSVSLGRKGPSRTLEKSAVVPASDCLFIIVRLRTDAA